tara:strand:- start:29163 stop:29645 length:483 start_codon:yes stop_codon:yes gene_type:complete
MGYYSDVGIVVAFNKRDDMEKVIATYKMNPDVQRLDLFAEWTIYESDDVHFLEYKNTYVKWYDDYDDVKAIRYLTKLVESFGEEQDMTYAWKELNVGEDGAIHEGDNHSPRGERVTDQATELEEFCDEWLSVEPATLNCGCDDMMVMHNIKQLTEEKVDG